MIRRPNETMQIGLRLKEGLRRRLAQLAHKAGTSMNAEIVRRIEQSFSGEDQLRDVFACFAMQALLAEPGRCSRNISAEAYEYADAMLAERSKSE